MLIHIKKSIANAFTIINLLLGFISIVLISLSFMDSQNNIKIACMLIFIAAFIDAFDGKIARKLGTSGDFGKEFDSLADLVSFCLAPSILIFSYSYDLLNLKLIYLIILSAFPLVCGAIRLAKFNAYKEHSNQSYYIGLPTPGNAIFICSSILFMFNMDFILYDSDLIAMLNLINPNNQESLLIFNWMKYPFSLLYSSGDYILIILCSFSSLLLISKINYSKFPILKFGLNFSNSINIIGIVIFFIILFIGAINKQSHIVMLFFISYYIVSGIIKTVIKKISKSLGRKYES